MYDPQLETNLQALKNLVAVQQARIAELEAEVKRLKKQSV